MSRTETIEENGIRVVVSNHGLSSGWDIVSLLVDGMDPQSGRAGEFATDKDAIRAAFERGEAERQKRQAKSSGA
ncbi:hypothetical protein PPUJ20028_33390 [Pseudomonas putida]|uniref:Uncharacterized protein n=1 Tax=Pseudomonas putida TaxID=303 RepID=A0AA37VSH4_PSEPU|nr:hypothetical protein [Pseudomonas putida]GLO14756.1 hypothetical protein PPUJ20028_33390 [Pseudomonas putida]GLO34877.1 hypothetical protein PPUN14671_17100 [Pseudomonas putida]HDS0963638.1 hypothetical protein [Pseudomonas putida]HDS0988898.1 hypothetical protein [Pseudomonas putida]